MPKTNKSYRSKVTNKKTRRPHSSKTKKGNPQQVTRQTVERSTNDMTRREYNIEKQRLKNERIKSQNQIEALKTGGSAAAKNIGVTGGAVATNVVTPQVTNAIVSGNSSINPQTTDPEKKTPDNPYRDERPD